MRRLRRGSALVAFTVLAVAASAVGPCHCVLMVVPCAGDTPETHSCCEGPVGVQQASDECCSAGPELAQTFAKPTDVAVPALRGSHVAFVAATTRTLHVSAVRTPPPLRFDTTTVLLI